MQWKIHIIRGIVLWSLALGACATSTTNTKPSVDKVPFLEATEHTVPLPVQITLMNATSREERTAQAMRKLFLKYDLHPWLFTTDIRINDNAVPHSHPILTLPTRHVNRPERLLATFIHQQLHWYAFQEAEAIDKASQSLTQIYPDLPIEKPQGALSTESNYLHLLIGYGKFKILGQLLSKEEAREIILSEAEDHYQRIYQIVLNESEKISQVVMDHGLTFEIEQK